VSVATLSTENILPSPLIPSQAGLTPGQWGVIAFLCSEVAFFSTLFVAYIAFYGRDSQPGGMGGPKPVDVLTLSLVIATTICLLLSSLTVHLADRAFRSGGGRSTFLMFWICTIALGTAFLLGTAYEWNGLIYRQHLTISRNLFGSTYYTLVGFHAIHVTVGVIVMLIVLGLAFRGHLSEKKAGAVQLVSWYWHFVDVVWIVVFGVVYLMPHMQ
jgi:cytochrome c oxidase subunit III